MKRNGNANKRSTIILDSEKGKEYSEIAVGIETTYKAWLEYSGIAEHEFLARLESNAPCGVIHEEDTKGNISIRITVNGADIIEPLLWLSEGKINKNEFYADSVLLLMFVSQKVKKGNFAEEVQKLSKNVIDDIDKKI